ncbi:MAG: hypothetical protein KDB04_13000 [Acidimicrobiales bacterium]|nr:hypothetical protein [Acidimicrobiales bacterium]
MEQQTSRIAHRTFEKTLQAFEDLPPAVSLTLASLGADVTLLVDSAGSIIDVAYFDAAIERFGAEDWPGRSWADTVTGESVDKIKSLIDECAKAGSSRAHQVNHPGPRGADLPVEYVLRRIEGFPYLVAYGTDLRECVLAGREALALSEETGQPGLSSVALDTLAIAAANVGDAELTDQVCRRELASGSLRGEVWARAALGRLHLVDDRPELAVEQFALLRRRIGERNASFTQFESDEAEALVRVGRVDEARALLDDLAADAAARGGWSEAQHQRILALLAEDIDVAAEHFERARDALADGANRIAQGIVELTWGEALRRAKRRADARRHLEAAIERFELVGASGLRRRAEAELAAAGGAVDRDRPTDELLTPLELQVARLAVAGHTNRTIAAELFLSPRTVENHLGAVYRKLGVSGRPGLSARAADDAVLRATTAGGGA